MRQKKYEELDTFIVHQDEIRFQFNEETNEIYLPYVGFEESTIHKGTIVAVKNSEGLYDGKLAVIEKITPYESFFCAELKYSNGDTETVDILGEIGEGNILVLTEE